MSLDVPGTRGVTRWEFLSLCQNPLMRISGLDANGLPNDTVAIAEHVIGANEDESSG